MADRSAQDRSLPSDKISSAMASDDSACAAQLNEFYRAILETIHDGVYFVDRQRRITYWNRGAERITGFLRQEVMGRGCKDNILVHCSTEGVNLCLDGCPLQATLEEPPSAPAASCSGWSRTRW